MTNEIDRRLLMKQFLLGGLGVGAGACAGSNEELCLASYLKEETQNDSPETSAESTEKGAVDGTTGATRTTFKLPQKAKLKEKIPLSAIGDVKLSRIFLGGNLIAGHAHARDLIYVSDLIKAYHTQNKVFETFYLAEECGINTFMGSAPLFAMMQDYWKWTDGQMQFIWQGDTDRPEVISRITDMGAVACYLHGERTDQAVREGRWGDIEKKFTAFEKTGLPVGIGAHRIETLRAVANMGIVPKFWVKTYHDHNYWSAHHRQEHDNIYCRKPDETREFMATRKEPWIAFKVLAAGAIRPEEGFRFAFEGGADFLCVGMYDFQIVDDVNIACEILKSPLARTRPWVR